MSLQLFEGLDRNRFEVKMYVQERREIQLDPDESLADDVIYGVEGRYRRMHLLKHFYEMLRLARNFDVVVGVSEGRASGLALLAGLAARRPVITWIHADWSQFSKELSWRTRLAVKAFNKASAIVACSHGVADAHAKSFPQNRDLLHIIPNGIDTKDIKALSKAELAKAEQDWFNHPTVVSVGRLHSHKGFDLLIPALAKAQRMGADFRSVIIGEGGEIGKLKELAQTMGIEENVKFLGFQDNPYRFMAKGTVFALSSRFEGFGLVVAEALACGAPVVSFDCPSGPSEILDGGQFGILVPAEDVDAMALAIRDLLADPQRLAELSANGPARAESFDIQRFSSRWEDLLSSVVSAGGHRTQGVPPIS